jgi:rhodanese-related sulfurtransferase
MSRLPRVLLFLAGFSAGFCASLRAGNVALGVVALNEPVPLELPFTNTGEKPVQLGVITTSCDCLQTTEGPGSIVAPGAVIHLPFTYRGTKPGRVSITVLISGVEKNQMIENATVSGFVADPSWMISPAELLARKDVPVFVIDTRRAERYQQAHLGRSINLPLFAVKTRSDLRDKAVVLVDEGFAPDVLLDEVNRLRVMGFTEVRVLLGGVIGWMRAGGAVEGAPSISAVEVAQVSPAEVERARRTTPGESIEAAHPEDVLRAVAPADSRPLLVIASEPTVSAQIEARVGPSTKRPVYYLAGGKKAWADYQIEQTALAAHTGQILQTKPSLARPMASGGCGACPK